MKFAENSLQKHTNYNKELRVVILLCLLKLKLKCVIINMRYKKMGDIGVYQIELNKKIYIGSSACSIKGRWKCHLSALRKGKHCNQHLQNAYNKYGENALMFSILEVVKTREGCIIVEQKYIDLLNPEYNKCPKAGSCLGVKRTKENKQKISDSWVRRREQRRYELNYRHFMGE